jgi:peroxiredoxin
LPLAELAVAACLVPVTTAAWGALGALTLLILFMAGIGASLARGRRPDCHCFGQLHSAPAGWGALLRNATLAAVAALLAWHAWQGDVGLSAVGWIAALSGAELAVLAGVLVVLVALIAQWSLLVALLRQNGRLLARLDGFDRLLAEAGLSHPNGSPVGSHEGLGVGVPAPSFDLPEAREGRVSLDSMRAAGKPVLLLFTDSDCRPCGALLPEVRRWQRDHAGELVVALVSSGPLEANRSIAADHDLRNFGVQAGEEVTDAFDVYGTPSAVLVLPDGAVGSQVAAGPEEIRALVARTAVTAPSPAFTDSGHLLAVRWPPTKPDTEAQPGSSPVPQAGRAPAEGD